jgi:hypothetical protein
MRDQIKNAGTIRPRRAEARVVVIAVGGTAEAAHFEARKRLSLQSAYFTARVS